jgi:hypothetical protein
MAGHSFGKSRLQKQPVKPAPEPDERGIIFSGLLAWRKWLRVAKSPREL